jgi:hypothetical protein
MDQSNSSHMSSSLSRESLSSLMMLEMSSTTTPTNSPSVLESTTLLQTFSNSAIIGEKSLSQASLRGDQASVQESVAKSELKSNASPNEILERPQQLKLLKIQQSDVAAFAEMLQEMKDIIELRTG